MLRLIDANEILKSEHQHYDYMADKYYVTVRDIENAPTVEAVPVAELPYTVWLTHDVVQVVRCKDCKHFLYDKLYMVEGLPLMGHLVCEKWGNGCRTDANRYCFLGERREDESGRD